MLYFDRFIKEYPSAVGQVFTFPKQGITADFIQKLNMQKLGLMTGYGKNAS